jgi:hypothetical protein
MQSKPLDRVPSSGISTRHLSEKVFCQNQKALLWVVMVEGQAAAVRLATGDCYKLLVDGGTKHRDQSSYLQPHNHP